MEKQPYWWYVYGYFTPGENNLPCTGEVIEYYFVLSGLSKREVAKMLNWTERYIEMLKSPRNQAMPKLLPRRIMLARALHIPPILLGLSSVTLLEWGNHTDNGEVLTGNTLAFYEQLLSVSWELYYTSTVQKAAGSIDATFELLERESQNATGVQQDQYDATRCRLLQLYSLVQRDRKETDQAITTMSEAIAIAFRLKNAELIASSLLRRARVYIQQKGHTLALNDALMALPYADLSRDPLRGKCYQMAGEAQGYLSINDRGLQEKCLTYFRTAAQVARKGDHTPDGSFVKTDLTSIYIEQAKILTLWGHYNDAHDALAIARKTLSPELTRWRINLLLAEAHVFFAQKDVDSCCTSLIEALPIIQAIQLTNRIDRVQTLCDGCKQLAPANRSVKQLSRELSKIA